MVFISALSGRGIDKLFTAMFDIYEHWNGRASTSLLNKWLDRALQAHPAPLVGGKRLRMKYITQVKTRPPTFVVFSTRPDKLPESYKRYLVNGIRKEFDFGGTPIRLDLRKRKNPYADKK
jgi:GTP-binding protein